MKVFMDDFSVYGGSFEKCLDNLGVVLQRCREKNLVLNWEKCHFMVQEAFVASWVMLVFIANLSKTSHKLQNRSVSC